MTTYAAYIIINGEEYTIPMELWTEREVNGGTIVSDIWWDKTDYTFAENEAIEKWISTNYNDLLEYINR